MTHGSAQMSDNPLTIATATVAAWREIEPGVEHPNTPEFYSDKIAKQLRQIAVIEQVGQSRIAELPAMRTQIEEWEALRDASALTSPDKRERADWLCDFRDAMAAGMAETGGSVKLQEALDSPMLFGQLLDAWSVYALERHALDAHAWYVREAGGEWHSWKMNLPLGRLIIPGLPNPQINAGLLRDRRYLQQATADKLQHIASIRLPKDMSEVLNSGHFDEISKVPRHTYE